MGFVKRNIELEKYLEFCGVEWSFISDSKFKEIYNQLNEFIDSGQFKQSNGDEAFFELQSKFPLDSYIVSAPRIKHIFSIYVTGSGGSAFGYKVAGLNNITREKLNFIECVVVDISVEFACMLNHEYQGYCPEVYIEKM